MIVNIVDPVEVKLTRHEFDILTEMVEYAIRAQMLGAYQGTGQSIAVALFTAWDKLREE